MKKVIVIGSAGSGKSTFSRRLSAAVGLPLHHLDLIWHRSDKTTIPREEFDAVVGKIASGEEWIIDGNYRRTLETRMKVCDTVFLFDIPVEDCLEGVRSRIGKKREDMPWIETEFDEDFRQWIINFPKNNLPMIYSLIEKYRDGRNIVIFRSRKEADEYIKSQENSSACPL